jgi:hypothetical protein
MDNFSTDEIQQVLENSGLDLSNPDTMSAFTAALQEEIRNALDGAVDRARQERRGTLRAEFAGKVNELRGARAASRDNLSKLYQEYASKGLETGELPEDAPIMDRSEMSNIVNRAAVKSLADQYRAEMLAARGKGHMVTEVIAKYRAKGLDVDHVSIYGRR